MGSKGENQKCFGKFFRQNKNNGHILGKTCIENCDEMLSRKGSFGKKLAIIGGNYSEWGHCQRQNKKKYMTQQNKTKIKPKRETTFKSDEL